MTKRQLIWNIEPAVEIRIRDDRKTSPFLQLVAARTAHRKIRIAPPTLPPRPACKTNRMLLAALREAELAAWRASGGDYLSSACGSAC